MTNNIHDLILFLASTQCLTQRQKTALARLIVNHTIEAK